jgi:hypothetical protein
MTRATPIGTSRGGDRRRGERPSTATNRDRSRRDDHSAPSILAVIRRPFALDAAYLGWRADLFMTTQVAVVVFVRKGGMPDLSRH